MKLIIEYGIIILTTIVLSFSFVYAKDKRRQTLNFEDELIEGNVKRPELLNLFRRKQFNFKRLIKLRKNFIPEMERTGENFGERGGKK
jgi:hypothetical protein